MKSNKIQISLKISVECYDAYRFLQGKKMNPAQYLRAGGEPLIIKMAEKYKFTLKKVKLPF